MNTPSDREHSVSVLSAIPRSIIALLGIVGLMSGCRESQCSHTGCVGTLDVVLPATLAEPGSYVVDLTLQPGTSARCTLKVPNGHGVCSERWAHPLFAADQSGGLDGIVVFRTDSETLSVSVAKDGAIIGGGTYRPDYEQWFPNGETCDEQPCQHAVVEVGIAKK